MKTTTRLWTCLVPLALAFAAAAPAGAASDPCDDTSSGWGWETASCTLSCSADVYLKIRASVDDSGSIDGSVKCGGVTANCVDGNYDGVCSGSSPGKTLHSGTGTCTATGYGGSGSVVWTKVTVECWTDNTGYADFVEIDDPGIGSSAESSAFPGGYVPHFDDGAAILILEGVVSGVVCKNGTCFAVTPNCDDVSCRIG